MNKRPMTSPPCEATIQERKQIRQVTWIGLLVNLFLSVIKCLAGFVGHSQALMADGLHSLSDITSDVAILLGEAFWLAPADENHPYGHRRIEAMVTVFIGFVLAVAAVTIGVEALLHLREKPNTPPGWITFLVAFVSFVLKEILFRYTLKKGTSLRSSAVIANAWHHRSDAFSSIPVMLAIFISILAPQWAFVDLVGALIVATFILYSAARIIKPALDELSDSGAGKNRELEMERIALKVQGVKSVHALRSRRSGSGYFVDLHVLVNPLMSVYDGHEIASHVKKQLLADSEEISDVLVHIEPSNPPHN